MSCGAGVGESVRALIDLLDLLDFLVFLFSVLAALDRILFSDPEDLAYLEALSPMFFTFGDCERVPQTPAARISISRLRSSGFIFLLSVEDESSVVGISLEPALPFLGAVGFGSGDVVGVG